MQMNNILVTGGVGFIGTNLIKSLIEKGFNVVSIDNYSTGSKSNEIQGVKYYNLDIEKISNYHNHLKKLGWISSYSPSSGMTWRKKNII